LIGLTRRLAPDFEAIADFRKDNGPAIRATCRRFIGVCRRLNLFAHVVEAIDCSKFKAVNALTRGKMQKRMEQSRGEHRALSVGAGDADRQEGELAAAKSASLKDKTLRFR
jgi:hypothetical protein